MKTQIEIFRSNTHQALQETINTFLKDWKTDDILSVNIVSETSGDLLGIVTYRTT